MKATPKTTVSMPKVIGATVVKLPKAKKLPGALAKPSKFYKGEEISEIKKPSIQKLSDFLNSVSSNQSKLRKYDFNEDYMSNDKKISAEEAARAVLAKVAEMLQASPLVKAYGKDHTKSGPRDGMVERDHAKASTSHETGVHKPETRFGEARHQEGRSIAGNMARIGTYYDRKTPHNPESFAGKGSAAKKSAREAHMNVIAENREMPKPNIPGAAPGMAKDESSSDASSMSSKGIHKLSKFVGKMEGKKGAGHPNGETGHEKGINTASDPKQKSRVMLGTSKAGSTMPANNAEDRSEAKQEHKKVLGEMKAMPKPNLTKSEHFELAKKLHNELTASSSLVKSEEKKASGSYGNVTPHLDHVGMAGLSQVKHNDLKHVHKQHAAVATAKGDTGLADKHAKMASMHQHYQAGILNDHRHIVVAGKLHNELSGKKGE